MPGQEHRKIEPLFSALHDDGASRRHEGARRRAAARSGLLWKLVIAALVFAGLLAIVLNQAF
jgi:hypothetical protein